MSTPAESLNALQDSFNLMQDTFQRDAARLMDVIDTAETGKAGKRVIIQETVDMLVRNQRLMVGVMKDATTSQVIVANALNKVDKNLAKSIESVASRL
jgi:hypothetical protein